MIKKTTKNEQYLTNIFVILLISSKGFCFDIIRSFSSFHILISNGYAYLYASTWVEGSVH